MHHLSRTQVYRLMTPISFSFGPSSTQGQQTRAGERSRAPVAARRFKR
jgi:hypothetical protein